MEAKKIQNKNLYDISFQVEQGEVNRILGRRKWNLSITVKRYYGEKRR